MSGMARECQLIPWSLPRRRTVERLERQLMLEAIIASVGVVDTKSMNRNARVRVRALSCRPTGHGDATCSYETDRCQGEEISRDGRRWCRRETRFQHLGSTASTIIGVDGWMIDRPGTEPGT